MLTALVTQYTGIPPTQINQWLGMTQSQLYGDATYKAKLKAFNIDLLYATLPHARAAYASHLGHFNDLLKEKYGLKVAPMSEFTLGNWLIGFLDYPDTLTELPRIHSYIPPRAVREMLPDMIQMLDDMPEGRAEWQAALTLLSLLLVAKPG